MIGDFRDGTDGAAGGADGVGLAESNGGGDALDAVNPGTIHSFEELAGVGAKGFGVAALAFGVEGVEGQGGFTGSGGSGQDMEHPEGKIEGEIPEIVLACALDSNRSGTFHGVGILARFAMGTNARLGLPQKKPNVHVCNIALENFSTA